MGKMQTTDMEKWKKIADEIRKVRKEMIKANDELKTIPKTVYNEDFNKALEGWNQMISNLEDRMFKEHPDKANTNIFYGKRND